MNITSAPKFTSKTKKEKKNNNSNEELSKQKMEFSEREKKRFG